MSLPILRKEWREHRFALGAYVGVMGLLYFVQRWSNAETASADSPFDFVRWQCGCAATLGAFFVSHRLIVREYGQKTQLFLEALPLSRARLLALKLVLGLAVLLLPVAFAFALAVDEARTHEQLTSRYLLLLAARAVLSVMVGWTLLALAGLVGRYRNPLLLFVALGLLTVDSFTALDTSKLGTALLLGDDFAHARQLVPWRGVLLCASLSAAFVAISCALTLYRDGTLTELLSNRMSHREKVFIACALVGFFYLGSLFDQVKAKEPFRLHEGTSASDREVTVQVAPAEGFSPGQARDVGGRVARDVAELSDALGLGEVPAVSLVPTGELDADVFELAELTAADGLVFRANFGSPDFDEPRFRAFLARELITWISRDHALRESRRWLRDGFAALWANRDEADPALLELRAAYAAERFSPARASEWLDVQEELGPCLSDAVSWLGVRVLREKLGGQAFASLIRAALGDRPVRGAWGLLRTRSIQAEVEARGLPWSAFLAAWTQALADARKHQAARLAGTHRFSATLWLDQDSSATFSVRHALAVEPPPITPPRYSFLYTPIGAFDAEVLPRRFERFSALSTGPVRTPRSFARGERWLWAVEVPEPALGCAVRVHRERREIR